jgi:hypothetical protein
MVCVKSAGAVAMIAVTLVALAAFEAWAEDALLYEVSERVTTDDGRRHATAALAGSVRAGTPLCPADFAASVGGRCALSAIASDELDLATRTGPVDARFAVVIQDSNPVDGPEVVVLEGTLSGTVDLSPTLPNGPGGPVPLGTITGVWSAKGLEDGPLAGVEVRGTFTGTFRLPFVSADAPNTPLYLLDRVTGALRPVAFEEFAVGYPAVLLEIDLS